MNKKINCDKVDETISAVEGGWEFTSEVAENFDAHVRKSIPLYDEVQQMTVDMSEWFIKDNSVVFDIGSSTGETIYQLMKKHRNKKNVRFIGIDKSRIMVKQAQRKVAAANIKFLHQDIMQSAFKESDLFISLFTMQFLTISERIQVLQKIYGCLNRGGALIMAEKIQAEEGRFNDLWMELYWDFKKKQGLTDDQILHKARSLRGVLIPMTLAENVELLKTAGFTNIDVFFKWYNFAGLLAIKTNLDSIKQTVSHNSLPDGKKTNKTSG